MESVISPAVSGKSEYGSFSLTGKSLGIFGPNNPFRRLLMRLVLHPQFDQVIILVIILSSVLMAIDSPLNDPNGSLVQFLT